MCKHIPIEENERFHVNFISPEPRGREYQRSDNSDMHVYISTYLTKYFEGLVIYK